MPDNPLTPVNEAAKSTTSRIDLSKVTSRLSPVTADAIHVVHPKAQTTRVGLGAMPANNDIYNQRTSLLDTSNIPLSSPATAPTAAPRTIRIGARPTIRIGGASSAPATFSPGRAEAPAAEEAAPAGRPTIKLKRPGGAVSISSPSASTSAPAAPLPFVISSEEEVGGVWTVFAILALLAGIGLIVVQILTNNGMNY